MTNKPQITRYEKDDPAKISSYLHEENSLKSLEVFLKLIKEKHPNKNINDVFEEIGIFPINLVIRNPKLSNKFIDVLVKYGFDVNKRAEDAYSSIKLALNYSLNRDLRLSIIKILISYGADVNLKQPYQETILSSICSRCDNELLELIINAGADVNEIYNHGPIFEYYLNCALKRGNISENIINLFIVKGLKKIPDYIDKAKINSFIKFLHEQKYFKTLRLIAEYKYNNLLEVNINKTDGSIDIMDAYTKIICFRNYQYVIKTIPIVVTDIIFNEYLYIINN